MSTFQDLQVRFVSRYAFLRLLNWLILAVFFLIPWRFQLHADWLPQTIDHMFLIMIPITLSLLTWLLIGTPGLRGVLHDRQRWWLLLIFALVGWALLSARWSPAPSLTSAFAQGLLISALFALMLLSTGPSAQ